MSRHIKFILNFLVLAGGIFVSTWIAHSVFSSYGLDLAILPACGIAFGALFRWGLSLWPGAALGILITHTWMWRLQFPQQDLQTALPYILCLGMGTFGGVLIGIYLLRAWSSSVQVLNRIRDTLIFVTVAFMASSFNSLVTLGVRAGIAPNLGELFWGKALVGWIGDLMGILIISPFFFVRWKPLYLEWQGRRIIELVFLMILFFVSSQTVFGTWLEFPHYPLVYLLFPCLVWAAGRFEQAGAIAAVIFVSSSAIWGTLEGRGPFAERSFIEAVSLLQFYLLVLTLMTLIFSAAVTEARSAEAHSARLGRILDRSSNEIYVMDARNFNFIEANLGALKNLGFDWEELSRMTALDLKPYLSWENYSEKIKPLLGTSNNEVVFETIHRRKDGTEYPVEIRVRRSSMDSREVLVAIAQDLTLKKEVEERLRISEEKFHQVVDNLNDVFWMYDAQSEKMIYASPSYEKVWGQPVKALYEDPNPWMQSVYEEDADLVDQAFPGDIMKKGYADLEYRIIYPDGSIRWIWNRGFPVKDIDGGVYRLAGFATDITEKKNALQELNLYRNHLEDLVKKRTDALEVTHRQLVHAEKLSASGKMAASMAHEFNNPIYGIRSILEKIDRQVSLDAKFKRFVDLAIRECDRISNLISKMLTFHSPSSEVWEWVDIHEVIEDILLLMNKKFKERKIVLKTHFDKNLPPIEVVPDQIQQVILNVLQNAEESLPDRGGEISLETRLMEQNIEIRIGDNGQGMTPEVQKNIFDPFFTTKPAVKGTGLGLSVSYGIIQMHGGKIQVESESGKGAVFIVQLPLETQKISRSSPSSN